MPVLHPGSLKPLRYFRPVDHVPPRRDVIGTPVLVFEVVGVLPYVEPQDRDLPVHQGTVLVGRAEDFELAARDTEPRPTAAESGGSRVRKLLLEPGKLAERQLDGIRQR